MKYRINLEIEVEEGGEPITDGEFSHWIEHFDDEEPTTRKVRRVQVAEIHPTPEGDRVRAILVHNHRGDLAARVWENSQGIPTVPWIDGLTPVDQDEVRLVLNAFLGARDAGSATMTQVRDVFTYWSDQSAYQTGGRPMIVNET